MYVCILWIRSVMIRGLAGVRYLAGGSSTDVRICARRFPVLWADLGGVVFLWCTVPGS